MTRDQRKIAVALCQILSEAMRGRLRISVCSFLMEQQTVEFDKNAHEFYTALSQLYASILSQTLAQS